jgi:hypothetical protein
MVLFEAAESDTELPRRFLPTGPLRSFGDFQVFHRRTVVRISLHPFRRCRTYLHTVPLKPESSVSWTGEQVFFFRASRL